MNRDLACRLGVDVGGTFTDLVLLARDGCLVTRKVLSTSGNYAEAIFGGIADVLHEAGIDGGNIRELIHGTVISPTAATPAGSAAGSRSPASTGFSPRREFCNYAPTGASICPMACKEAVAGRLR
jgi:N-methylhydantoinase A